MSVWFNNFFNSTSIISFVHIVFHKKTQINWKRLRDSFESFQLHHREDAAEVSIKPSHTLAKCYWVFLCIKNRSNLILHDAITRYEHKTISIFKRLPFYDISMEIAQRLALPGNGVKENKWKNRRRWSTFGWMMGNSFPRRTVSCFTWRVMRSLLSKLQLWLSRNYSRSMQFLVALGASFKYFFSFSPLCLFGEGVSREMFTEMFFEAHPPEVGRGERDFLMWTSSARLT